MIDRAINLISVLGVIGSLIFVGLEVRQAHTIALATQVQARLEQQLDRNRTWFEGQWELGYTLATTPYEQLSDSERWARDQDLDWIHRMQQNSYYQYKIGLLSDEQASALLVYIERYWGMCDVRHVYDFPALEPAYAEYLRSLDDPCE